MNILEAVKKANEIDGYITRPKYRENLFIKPTNHCMSCMMITVSRQSVPIGRGWQPQEDDLLAEDWTVLSKTEYIAMVDWKNMKDEESYEKHCLRQELAEERSSKWKLITCCMAMFIALITTIVKAIC